MRPSLCALAFVLAFTPSPAGGQCPDGSRPPCGRQGAAPTRTTANPPLDDRTWIVMPFDNVSNSSDVEWLRNASANLLYLDMSRWQDIRVVDDERVADLLREAPSSATVSLASALAIAKRAGAGKLVMGDVIKSGSRTMLTAKVFDVKDGQRTSTVRDETTVQDSVIPLFGRLARKILRVDPPAGSSVGMVGTTSVRAYQAYLLGVQAINRFDLEVAKRELRSAITLDSSFALAHYKLATALGWFEGGDPKRFEHAEASFRFSSSLPARERRLIDAQLWHIRGDMVKAARLYADAIRADSSDVEAWHGLGETQFHDNRIVRDSSDPARVRFRGDWNAANRAFERVLLLDPTYHVAYPHLVDMFRISFRTGCLPEGSNPCAVSYMAAVRFAGDTLQATPIAAMDTAGIRRIMTEHVQRGGSRRELARADTMSLRWLGVAGREAYAHIDRLRVLLALGRLQEANDVVARIGPVRGTFEIVSVLQTRLDLALQRMDIAGARRLYDSVRAVPAASQVMLPLGAGSAARFMPLGEWVTHNYGFTFGHFAAAGPVLRGFGAEPTPLVMRYRRAFARLMAGFPDSLVAVERAQFDETASRAGVAAASRGLAGVMSFGLNAARDRWPAMDTASSDVRVRNIVAKMRNDTASLRGFARMIDSTSRAASRALTPDTAISLQAVEAYLAAGDSLAALRLLRFTLDTALATIPPSFPVSGSGTTLYAATLPRLMRQRADLAAALGQRDEAILWYRRFVQLWATADAEVQPIVSRARAALAALGGA